MSESIFIIFDKWIPPFAVNTNNILQQKKAPSLLGALRFLYSDIVIFMILRWQ